LFAHFDHGGDAAKADLTMQPAHVLVLGSPKAGTPLLVAAPLIALELPLKMLVSQDEAAHVWVFYTEPAFLADRSMIPPDLVKVLAGVNGVVQAALSERNRS
jgi:uncharacterized protein (DUF302 family)